MTQFGDRDELSTLIIKVVYFSCFDTKLRNISAKVCAIVHMGEKSLILFPGFFPPSPNLIYDCFLKTGNVNISLNFSGAKKERNFGVQKGQ